MKIKQFLEERKAKCDARLDDLAKKEDDLNKKNEEGKEEAELKAVADEIAELEAEKAELVAELKEIEAQLAALDAPKEGEEGHPNAERSKFLQFEERKIENMNKTNIEERKAKAEAFKNGGAYKLPVEETRATLVSGGTIATPTEVNGIVDTFNRVSSIVDLVKVENCEGMGANKVAYEISLSSATAQTEGQAIGASDPQYGYVTITPESIGVLSQISKQVRKQSPLAYTDKIVDSAEKALRINVAAYITKQILASSLIDKTTVAGISAIDEKTLRNVALAYGSPEAVYGDAWLFLTKKDLIAFGDVRSATTLQAVYEITPDTANPNTGVIKDGGLSVRYCLNPNLTALADADSGNVSMFYGQPECAELDLFSDYEVKVSEDFAFDKNMLTIRGDAEIGCDVIKKDGFIAVTKA